MFYCVETMSDVFMQVPVARKKFLWNVEMMRNSRKVAHESRRNYEVSSVILVNELKSFDLPTA